MGEVSVYLQLPQGSGAALRTADNTPLSLSSLHHRFDPIAIDTDQRIVERPTGSGFDDMDQRPRQAETIISTKNLHKTRRLFISDWTFNTH